MMDWMDLGPVKVLGLLSVTGNQHRIEVISVHAHRPSED